MNSMAQYEYTPLDALGGEIRLLTLLPGRFNAPICVTLKSVFLSAEKHPPFNALSYTWGNAIDPLNIHVTADRRVQGIKSVTLSITRSLSEALRHLRQKRRSTVLWIDQICIDQLNLKEKGHQVLMMPNIYCYARSVIVWLGPESDDSNVGMRILNKIGPDVTADWKALHFEAEPSSSLYSDGIDLSSRQWLSITNLLSRSWFERLWVVQEICLPRTRICMVCGFGKISFENFIKATCYLAPMASVRQHPIFAAAKSLTHMKVFGTDGLFELMEKTRNRKCSDKRDRVYAILSLLPKEERAGLHPNYSITAEDVYEECVLQQLKRHVTLRALSRCSIKHRSMAVPSWVPDWSANPKLYRLPLVCADYYTRAHAYSITKGILAVTGVSVTVVHEIKIDLLQSILENRMKSAILLRQLLSTSVGQDRSNSHSRLHSLCTTLCGGLFSEKSIPNSSLPSFKVALDYFISLYEWSLVDSAEPPKPCLTDRQVITLISRVTNERSLVITADGRLGLAPEGTVSGDLVCVILGCLSPMILRSKDSSTYEVVGECYIDGIMAGETLLGELPRNWFLVQKYFPEHGGTYHILFDSDKGNTCPQDPRLGPLPIGWRIKNHAKDNVVNWYINDITGEESIRYDPRLELDALKARGIHIREFRLI